MDAWIRSQDGMAIVKPTGMYATKALNIGGSRIYAVDAAGSVEDPWTMGVYPDEAAAMRVMDEIARTIAAYDFGPILIDLAEIDERIANGDTVS